MRRFLRPVLLLVLGVTMLTSCAQATGRSALEQQPAGTNPNATCPSGWTRLSAQSWWQRAGGGGKTAFPQALGPGGVGGHLHVESCFPVNRRVDGVVHFDVDIMTHQGFTGSGKVFDIGLAPDGRSVAKVDVPDLECGPKPAKCHARVAIDLDTDKLPSGLQSLRFRYNNTDHPNGDRQFAGTEWPLFVRSEPSELGQVGGKSWFTDVDYANVRFDHGLPIGPQRGTITFDFYSKGDHVQAVSTHVDARFGDDDEGTIVDQRSGEYRGPVSIDTTRFTNGWHCLALRADASRGDGGVSTGVLEIPLLIDNPGAESGNGTGSCFSM